MCSHLYEIWVCLRNRKEFYTKINFVRDCQNHYSWNSFNQCQVLTSDHMLTMLIIITTLVFHNLQPWQSNVIIVICHRLCHDGNCRRDQNLNNCKYNGMLFYQSNAFVVHWLLLARQTSGTDQLQDTIIERRSLESSSRILIKVNNRRKIFGVKVKKFD